MKILKLKRVSVFSESQLELISDLNKLMKKQKDNKLSNTLKNKKDNIEDILDTFNISKDTKEFDYKSIKKLIKVLKYAFSIGLNSLPNELIYDDTIRKYIRQGYEEPIVDVSNKLEHSTKHEYIELQGNIIKCNVFSIKEELKQNDDSVEYHVNDFMDVPVRDGIYYVNLTAKADGVGAVSSIENSHKKLSLTRGDDDIGSDITKALKDNEYDDDGKSRGVKWEMVITRDNFEKYCKERKKDYASLRTAVTSIVTSADKRWYKYLSLVPLRTSDMDVTNINKMYDMYTTDAPMIHKLICGKTKKEILKKIKEFIDYIAEIRYDKINYDIDGVVIEFMNPEIIKQFGRVGNRNKNTIAYKYPPEERFTKVRSCYATTGRTGRSTVLLEYDKINFYGNTYDHTAILSYDVFKSMNLREGEIVRITYNGKVMPYVHKYECKENDELTTPFLKYPTKCSCGNELQLVGALMYCDNPMCPSKIFAAYAHFYDTFNIPNIKENIIEKLYKGKVITGYGDLLTPDFEKMYDLEGFKEKSISKFKRSIDKLMNTTIFEYKIISALGIAGDVNAKKLCSYVPVKEQIKNIDILHSIKIDSFDVKSKNNYIKKFKLMKEFVEQYYNMLNTKEVAVDDDAINITFKGFRNKALKDALEKNGYSVKEKVSKKIQYVIVSSKEYNTPEIDKAKEWGIPIMTLDEFKNVINDNIDLN